MKLLWLLCISQAFVGLSIAVAAASIPAAPATNTKGNLYRFDAGLRLGDARLFSPWWNALQRNTLQRVEFDLCMANASTCPRKWRALRQLMLRGQSLSIKDRLELVNRYLNRQGYDEDRRWNNPEDPVPGVRSHWSTLYEFLERGGDCEDYAASKYFLLRMLGIDSDRMRVVVAWERDLRGYHAVLAYRWADGRVWLLESDNVIKKRSHFGYRYVYALSEQGVWDYRPQP